MPRGGCGVGAGYADQRGVIILYSVFCTCISIQRPADMTRCEPMSHLTHSFVPLCAAACFGEFYTGHATSGARECEAGFVSAPAVGNDGGLGHCCQAAVCFEGGRLASRPGPEASWTEPPGSGAGSGAR